MNFLRKPIAFCIISAIAVLYWINFIDQVDIFFPVENISNPKNVLALVRYRTPRPERESLIANYKSIFSHFYHCLPHSELETPTLISDDHFYCGDVMNVYDCLIDGMLYANKHNLEGLFFFHFDMWIDPVFFLSLDYSRPWTIQPSPNHSTPIPIPNGCASLSDENGIESLFGQWGWYYRSDIPRYQSLLNSLSFISQGQSPLCAGWSDLFYLPASMFPELIVAANQMKKYDQVFMEFGIPTMINLAANYHGIEPFLMDCYGGCCEDLDDPSLIFKYSCGHRLNLRNSDMTKAHFDRVSNFNSTKI